MVRWSFLERFRTVLCFHHLLIMLYKWRNDLFQITRSQRLCVSFIPEFLWIAVSCWAFDEILFYLHAKLHILTLQALNFKASVKHNKSQYTESTWMVHPNFMKGVGLFDWVTVAIVKLEVEATALYKCK